MKSDTEKHVFGNITDLLMFQCCSVANSSGHHAGMYVPRDMRSVSDVNIYPEKPDM